MHDKVKSLGRLYSRQLFKQEADFPNFTHESLGLLPVMPS
jgi:hypothetical protein